MKKKLLTLLAVPFLLTSCGNGFGGSSFAYESYTATYQAGETEATFFEGFTEYFANMQAFVNSAVTHYTSTKKDGKPTKNGCLNFTNEIGLTGATYKGRAVSVYLVNHESVGEHESTDRCAYFVENGNAKFVDFSTGTEYVDYVIKAGFQHNETIGAYSYYDTSMKIENSKLIMCLSLNLKITEGEKVTSNKTADVTVNWNKK